MTVAIVDSSSKKPATPFAVLIDKGKATSTTLLLLKPYTPQNAQCFSKPKFSEFAIRILSNNSVTH